MKSDLKKIIFLNLKNTEWLLKVFIQYRKLRNKWITQISMRRIAYSFCTLLLDFIFFMDTNQGVRITKNIIFQAKNIYAHLKHVPRRKIYGNLKSLAKTKTLQKRLQTRQAIIIQICIRSRRKIFTPCLFFYGQMC